MGAGRNGRRARRHDAGGRRSATLRTAAIRCCGEQGLGLTGQYAVQELPDCLAGGGGWCGVRTLREVLGGKLRRVASRQLPVLTFIWFSGLGGYAFSLT